VVDPRADEYRVKASEMPLFHQNSKPTDDSVLGCAIMEWLMARGELKPLLKKWYRAYPESGFGGKFSEWAFSDHDSECESFGNGAAMRIFSLPFVVDTPDELFDLAASSAVATHKPEHAVMGAQAIAYAIFMAKDKVKKGVLKKEIETTFEYDLSKSLDQWRKGYVFSSLCENCVPPAIRAFLESDSYEETVRRAISIGGDSDTIASMAGAIAGAYYGIDDRIESAIWQRLDDRMQEVVNAFVEHVAEPVSS